MVSSVFGNVRGSVPVGRGGAKVYMFEDAIVKARTVAKQNVELWNSVSGDGGPLDYEVNTITYKNEKKKDADGNELYTVHCKIGTKNVHTMEHVPMDDVGTALANIASFLNGIDTKNPNITDDAVLAIYNHVKESRKPKQKVLKDGSKTNSKLLLRGELDGETFWSDKYHTYFSGHVNASGNWVSPQEPEEKDKQDK